MKNVKKVAFSAILSLTILSCKEKKTINDCSLSYDNTIYWLKEGSEVIIKPSISPSERGLFGADPDGLVIDSQTGEINISKSATGHAYQIKYISLDNKYLCQTNLTISGIDYPDGIYNINDQTQAIVKCFYNADIRNEAPVGVNTVYDIGGRALQNGLVVDQTNGSLNLKESFTKGLFGSNPVDGTTRDITFNYRINDQSNSAQNVLSLTAIYYKSSKQIPAALLERLKSKQLYPGGRTGATEGHRPPDIIVVQE